MTEVLPAKQHVRERARARGTAAERAREDLRQQMTKLTSTRECVRCGMHYDELTNLGTWKCKFHWGTVESERFNVAGSEAGHWTCCGRATGSTRPLDDAYYPSGEPYYATRSRGCARCDHVANVNVEHEPARRIDRATARRIFGDHYEQLVDKRPGQQLDPHTGDLVVSRHE